MKKINIPTSVLSQAITLRNALLCSTTHEVLLHGDLHHDNIISNHDYNPDNTKNQWLVIDPKGFIGDPLFDVIAFVYNPIPQLLQENNPQSIIDKRIAYFAQQFGINKQRLYQWLYVRATLGWAWNLQDNLDIDYWKKLIHHVAI